MTTRVRVRISHHKKSTTHSVEGRPTIISVHEFAVWLVVPAGVLGPYTTFPRPMEDRILLGWGSDDEKAYALELAIKDWRHTRQNRRRTFG